MDLLKEQRKERMRQAVHVYGKARLIEDEASLEKLVEQMTAVYESQQPNPWQPRLAGERRTKPLRMIVGFEIEAQAIQGKFKLGQNRSAADQRAVVSQLSQSPLTSEVAKLMPVNLTASGQGDR